MSLALRPLSVTFMPSFTKLVKFRPCLADLYLSHVPSRFSGASHIVGCVTVACDDKCFGCVTILAWISGYGFRQIQLARGPFHVTVWRRYLGSASVELDTSSV